MNTDFKCRSKRHASHHPEGVVLIYRYYDNGQARLSGYDVVSSEFVRESDKIQRQEAPEDGEERYHGVPVLKSRRMAGCSNVQVRMYGEPRGPTLASWQAVFSSGWVGERPYHRFVSLQYAVCVDMQQKARTRFSWYMGLGEGSGSALLVQEQQGLDARAPEGGFLIQ